MTKKRILLHGFINVNVMDGSAVFITGLAKMLALNPKIKVDFILATPIHRDILLKDLYELENVNIISPFDDDDLISSNPPWVKRGRFNYDEAAYTLAYYWNKKNYDWAIIRGMDVVSELTKISENFLKKTMTYVTGITSENQNFSQKEVEYIDNIFKKSAYLLCQTNEMKDFLRKKFPNSLDKTEVITLNPMIPDTVDKFEYIFEEKKVYNKLCYVGKFHQDWNSIEMIVGFREIKLIYPEATFSIAGDKFSVHKDSPHYNEDLKYLLENTENLHWYGALSRNDARSLILNTDIGITWRDSNMDESLELSTKLLEYGSFGKAVIMNKTKMHTKIFGEDYPLYVSNMDEYEKALNSVINDPSLYYKAAKRMFEVSKKFTYSATLNKINNILFGHDINDFLHNNGFNPINDYNEQIVQIYPKINVTQNKNYCLFKLNLININKINDALLHVSDIGIIKQYQLYNSFAYLIIEQQTGAQKENLYYNFRHHFSKKLLSTVSNVKSYEKEVNTLKFKSKLQFPLLNNGKQSETNIEQSFEVRSLNRRIKELEQIERKYQSLSKSKLGKLTLKYWKIRNKTK